MRIRSIDHKAWLDLSRNGNGPHASFSIECSVDIGHGRFSARNGDVHFLNPDRFVALVDAFVLDRELTPQLDGTYDTRVRLFRGPGRSVVMAGFAIADTYCGQSAVSQYRTQGDFAIDAGYLNDIVNDFTRLLRPD